MSAIAQEPVVLPTFRLDGQSAVVTGASAGLGYRFAQVLAASGATVYAAARRADRLAELARNLPSIHPIACDVSQSVDRQRLIATVLKETGRIDILVNNAGVGGAQRIEDDSVDQLTDVLQVNLVAAFELAKLAGEQMGDGSGSIINVASILGLVSGAPLGGASYAASKGALIALTKELAGQWGRRGIRVNALAPGWVHTEMTEELFADDGASKFVNRNTMLNRGGRISELDGALLFLASEAASYCTGQVLIVDGGWTAR
jgi:NAD(P)-dependent dehydrogenase (short-subunit alcohol dehydrogenase family)